ncbi:hypothetical protein FOL47_007536 [Perkinsus chesapeaki]|uniref:Uncharacterized protein n=1 Tax=Perkinsus chesapeaki TaxID=330153 RepID=A0A7J6MVE1_PERCH|nr:hypothetical protein FOL47_007536 [Perkinsus chesapeaki]
MLLPTNRPTSPAGSRRDHGLQKCIAFSILSMLGFGATSYVMALATGILESSIEKYYWIGAEWKMMTIIWFTASLPGVACYIHRWVLNRRIEFFWSDHNNLHGDSITIKTKALTLLGGLLLGLSLSLMKKAFVFTSPAEKGPVTAILGTAIVVVSLYGHFVFGELLTKKHAFLIFVILAGVVISSLGSGSASPDDSTIAYDYEPYEAFGSFPDGQSVIFNPERVSPDNNNKLGFAFAILAMLSMSGTTLLIRYSAIGKQSHVSTWSGFASRQCVLSVLAVIAGLALTRSDENKELPATVLPNEVIGLAVIAGLSQTLAIFALNVALSYPSTSLVNVIASSHSVVVLFLNFAIDGLLPCMSQLIGMSILLTGVILSSLLPPSKAIDNNSEVGNKRRASIVINDVAREPLLLGHNNSRGLV